MPPPILLLLAALTALAVGITDYRTGHMPNALTLGSLALALLVQFGFGGGAGLGGALSGALVCGLGPGLLFYFSNGKGIGGGDVKSLAALGGWLGPDLGLECELFAFIILLAGALVSGALRGEVFSLLRRSLQVARPSRSKRRSTDLVEERTEVRFGPYLAAAVLLCCLNQWVSSFRGPLEGLL